MTRALSSTQSGVTKRSRSDGAPIMAGLRKFDQGSQMNRFSNKNRRVRASLITGLLLMIAPYRASGQPGPVESSSNIECLEHLEVPDYPPLTRTSRFQAVLTEISLLFGSIVTRLIRALDRPPTRRNLVPEHQLLVNGADLVCVPQP